LNSDGTTNLLDEYSVTSLDANGNPYVSNYYGISYSDNRYVFDITNIIQKIVNGKISIDGLLLTHRNGAENPSRVVLKSGNHTNGIKLKISLTKA